MAQVDQKELLGYVATLSVLLGEIQSVRSSMKTGFIHHKITIKEYENYFLRVKNIVLESLKLLNDIECKYQENSE